MIIMRELTVSVIQFTCVDDRRTNLEMAEAMIRRAAVAGAKVILLPELFETPYFCKDQKPEWFGAATAVDENPALKRLTAVAAELGVVLPVSFFERANAAYYNSLAMVDADGRVLGVYRKSHIPDGPGYQEKYYFNPGDTGFKVFQTRYARIGAAICWDQWFPETARVMALKGAEILCYPTAIGSEPQDASIDSRDHWTRVMQGHAGANLTPLLAANRYGREQGESCAITFYGSSFIAGPTGELVDRAERSGDSVLTATFDLDRLATSRASWGLFRDRRPELYGPLLTLDGATRPDR
jgi:N-carbamoylputrescine amidase